jgi:3-dehydroquinate synthase II
MKFAWIMAEGKVWDIKKQFITTALESGIEYVVDFSDVDKIKKLGNLSLVSDTDDADILWLEEILKVMEPT